MGVSCKDCGTYTKRASGLCWRCVTEVWAESTRKSRFERGHLVMPNTGFYKADLKRIADSLEGISAVTGLEDWSGNVSSSLERIADALDSIADKLERLTKDKTPDHVEVVGCPWPIRECTCGLQAGPPV